MTSLVPWPVDWDRVFLSMGLWGRGMALGGRGMTPCGRDEVALGKPDLQTDQMMVTYVVSAPLRDVPVGCEL